MEEEVVQTDGEQSSNLLSQLAEKRREIADTKDVFLPVPGYDKEAPILLIKYRLLTGPELERIGQKVRREVKGRWDRQLEAAVETFIAACDGVYVDLEDGKDPQPLTINGREVTGFTRDLAEGLEFADRLQDPDRARDVLFGLFANNDVAISKHNFLLNMWMSDTSVDISKEMYEGNL